MTTIGKVAYVATWDATNLSKGILSAQAMFREQRKITQSLMTPTERYSAAVTNLENIVAKYPDVAKHKVRLMREIEKQYKNEEHAAKKSADGIRNADLRRQQEEAESVKRHREALKQRLADRKAYNDRMRAHMADSLKYWQQENAGFMAAGGSTQKPKGGGMGAMAMGALGRGGVIGGAVASVAAGVSLKNTVASSVDARMELERTSTAFNVFAGSMDKANVMINTIRKLSADTGVSSQTLNKAARTMLNFGLNVEDVMPMMRQIATVTGGESDKMQSLALAMAQVGAAGKLMGQEVIQMVNAGWSPWEELTKKTGLTMKELRKEMELGNLSFEMVADALRAATEEGGRYFGFLEALDGTTARAADRSKAAWEKMYADVGTALTPITNKWYAFTERIASDMSAHAEVFSGKLGTPEIDPEAEKQERKEKARQDRAAKVAAERARVEAALAEQEKRRQEEKQMGLDRVGETQMNILRNSGSIDADSLAKFDRYVSLMSEENKKKAMLDFATFQNLDSIIGMLDKEVQAELRQTAEMEKQWKLQGDIAKKREEFSKMGEDIASQIDREMRSAAGVNVELEERLTKLIALRNAGKINDEQFAFARDQAARQSTSRQGQGSRASNVMVGSQEAYQLLAGIQDRNFKIQMQKTQEQTNLQRAMVVALEKANVLLDEISDNAIGSAG
jgi:tape measure domain-containing protein